jgi:hypothetical protein
LIRPCCRSSTSLAEKSNNSIGNRWWASFQPKASVSSNREWHANHSSGTVSHGVSLTHPGAIQLHAGTHDAGQGGGADGGAGNAGDAGILMQKKPAI